MTVISDPITLRPLGPGPVYEKVGVWLPQLFLEATRAGLLVIEDRTFVECLIEGPAVLLPMEGCNFDNCHLGDAHADPRNLMLQPAAPQRVTGPIPLKNCRFDRCSFVGVGFTGNPAFLDQMIAALGGAPA